MNTESRRLPLWRRRLLAARLIKLEAKIWAVEQLIDGTADDDGDEDGARNNCVAARMATGAAAGRLLDE